METLIVEASAKINDDVCFFLLSFLLKTPDQRENHAHTVRECKVVNRGVKNKNRQCLCNVSSAPMHAQLGRVARGTFPIAKLLLSLPLPDPQSVTRNEIRETKYGTACLLDFFRKE